MIFVTLEVMATATRFKAQIHIHFTLDTYLSAITLYSIPSKRVTLAQVMEKIGIIV